MECGYPPFNWTQADNSNGAVPIAGTNSFAGGYDVEIAKMLAKSMGKDLVIVKTAWDGLVPAVQSVPLMLLLPVCLPPQKEKRPLISPIITIVLIWW